MKAIRIHTPGGPEVLRDENVPDPTPGPGEVLVRVEAAGVNFIEIYQRTGAYRIELPATPGTEAAGTVAAVGVDVADFRIGDRVTTVDARGAYAELAIVPDGRLIRLPDAVSAQQAAAVMLQGMTAHYLASSS